MYMCWDDGGGTLITSVTIFLTAPPEQREQHPEDPFQRQISSSVFCVLNSTDAWLLLLFQYFISSPNTKILVILKDRKHEKRKRLDCHVSTACPCDDVGVMVLIRLWMCGPAIHPTFLFLKFLSHESAAPWHTFHSPFSASHQLPRHIAKDSNTHDLVKS